MNQTINGCQAPAAGQNPEPLHSKKSLDQLVCRACSNKNQYEFFHIPALPVNVGNFYSTREAAKSAATAPITLVYCPACGLTYNKDFASDSQIFEPGYEVSLRHSETFRKFISGVASRLIERFDLNNRRVLEIGCGDAYFLEQLAKTGGNTCIGIDPTLSAPGIQKTGNGSLELVRDYFGERHTHHKTDFICSLSVFEDIPDISGFLAQVHRLATQNKAPLYFEVFNAWRALENNEVWSIHFEQCNYFSLESLQNVFNANGFSIREAGPCYAGDQYLYVEAAASPEPSARQQLKSPKTGLPETLAQFAVEFEGKKARWEQQFLKMRAKGKKVVLWGTGGKGVTFLNSVPSSEIIENVIEINPDKQGKFMPGTGQCIVPPDALTELNPDIVIITNPIYEEEMKKQARQLHVDPQFLIA